MEERNRPSVADYAAEAQRYQQEGDVQAAMRSYLIATHLQMLQLNPTDAAACFQLGMAFGQAGEDDRAQAAFRAALVLQPAHAQACNNLGVLSDAPGPLRHALRLAPSRADYHTNLAHVLLSAGSLSEGFREWEWRAPSPPRSFTEPRWDGSPFPGKTLLIHAEQGYGDCIQFARYIPHAAARGGRVIVEMRPPLAGLMARIEGVAEVVPWGSPLPPFDVHLPLPSLANLFQGAPTATPYLRPNSERIAFWRNRLAAPGRLRVGVVWACNPAAHDQRRSIPFGEIAEWIAQFPDIAFFGLQREGAQSCRGLISVGPEIGDFDDMAAILCSLDLLVSVDTAAAHLAGALGRDSRVLLRQSPDWRWRGTWYPSVRSYRQTQEGSWRDVLEQVGASLRQPD